MALSVKLYRVVGKGKDRRYIPIDLGRRGRRSKEEVTGPFYLRYGVKYESVGSDFKAAVEAMQRRQATLEAEAVGSGVAVKPDGDPNRKQVVDEVKKFLAEESSQRSQDREGAHRAVGLFSRIRRATGRLLL